MHRVAVATTTRGPILRKQLYSQQHNLFSRNLTKSSIYAPSTTTIATLPSNPNTSCISYGFVQKRNMFIQTQETPNPESLMFFPGQEVISEGSTAHFETMEDALVSPLARHLLRIEGVRSLMFGSDFITVNKHSEHTWIQVKPEVFATMMDFFASGAPVIDEGAEAPSGATPIHEDDDDTVLYIKSLLDSRIRPFVQEDGGDIEYVSFDEGILYLRMQGACGSCPSAGMTLKGGIENMVMHYVPEVKGVEQVLDEVDQVNEQQFQKLEQSLKKED